MEKRKKANKKKDTPRKLNISGTYVLGLIVAIFLSFMIIQIYQLKQKEIAYEQREMELQEAYDDELERSDEIEALSDYMKTTQYIEDTAKTKLGLAYEDELIFKESEEK